jgi:ABC-type antimicrobial peptide transport system permease subunit
LNGRLLARSALLRLWRYRARSFFTGLAIALGVFSTVALLTLEGRVRERFRLFLEDAYPADGIVLIAGSGPMGGPGPRNLRLEDVEAVAAETALDAWDPVVMIGFRDVRGDGAAQRAPIVGGSHRAPHVRRRGAAEGAYFDATGVASAARVALLGTTTAGKLFPGRSAVGERIFVDNLAFAVVGVLEPRGADPHGGDLDDIVVVPYTTLQSTLSRSTALSGAMFRVADRARVEALAREMTAIVRNEHGIVAGQPDDFSVFTSASMQAMFRRSFRTVQLFGPLLSATLFLIAALVVLTLGQLGVKARRREIGLRRAVGARGRDIETQLVVETLAISTVAALAGLLLAQGAFVVLGPLAERKFGLDELAASPTAAISALVGAWIAGLAGGVWPARRAARLDPVAALR